MTPQSILCQLQTSRQCWEARITDQAHLKQENECLRKELDYIYKLLKAGRKLLSEIQAISQSLHKSVLEFRSNQKTIDCQFLQETQI